MAAEWPTLVDVAKRLDPDGRIPVIAEMLAKVNPILQDVPMKEGNLITGHQGTIRSGLPTVAWRLLNYGTQPTKSRTKQVQDTCGILESYSEIDKEVYRLNGSGDAFRMTEDTAHVESMAQELASTLFYGNSLTDPEKFTGLAVRYSDTVGPDNAAHVINVNSNASAQNTSIWCISWGERSVHGIYPKGSMAGLEYQNLGEQTKRDSGGRMMQVMVSHFMQKFGIHVKDWAGVVRAQVDAATIDDPVGTIGEDPTTGRYLLDPATAQSNVFTGPRLLTVLHAMLHQIPLRLRAAGAFRPVFYVNPTMKQILDLHAEAAGYNQLKIEDVEGRGPITKYRGVPIIECDAILDTEAQITTS